MVSADAPLKGKTVLLVGEGGPFDCALQSLIEKNGMTAVKIAWCSRSLQSQVWFTCIITLTLTLIPVSFYSSFSMYKLSVFSIFLVTIIFSPNECMLFILQLNYNISCILKTQLLASSFNYKVSAVTLRKHKGSVSSMKRKRNSVCSGYKPLLSIQIICSIFPIHLLVTTVYINLHF